MISGRPHQEDNQKRPFPSVFVATIVKERNQNTEENVSFVKYPYTCGQGLDLNQNLLSTTHTSTHSRSKFV